MCNSLSKNVSVGHANFKSSLKRHPNSNSKNVWEDQHFMTLLSTLKNILVLESLSKSQDIYVNRLTKVSEKRSCNLKILLQWDTYFKTVLICDAKPKSLLCETLISNTCPFRNRIDVWRQALNRITWYANFKNVSVRRLFQNLIESASQFLPIFYAAIQYIKSFVLESLSKRQEVYVELITR